MTEAGKHGKVSAKWGFEAWCCLFVLDRFRVSREGQEGEA